MGLLELKSKLAVGAGQPMGSPTGNNMGSSVAPQEVDYFPNIHATGFTMNFGGPPSLFTLNGVPEVVNSNPIGRHTAGMETQAFNVSDITGLKTPDLIQFNQSDVTTSTPQLIQFNQSDVTSFQQNLQPFEQSDVTSFQPNLEPFEQSDVTSFQQELVQFPQSDVTTFTQDTQPFEQSDVTSVQPELIQFPQSDVTTFQIDTTPFLQSDVTGLNSVFDNLNPFLQSDVTSVTPDTNPFEQSNITSFEAPELIDWFQISIDNSPLAERSPRQPFNFPSLETPPSFESYNANGRIPPTELSTDGQYDKLPYRDNNVIGFDQPFIIKDIGNKAGIDAVSSVPGLGMISTMVGKATDDVFRIGKFLLTPQGIMFGAKQWFFHKMNTFPHTRQWNPESLFSIVPMVRIPTHGEPGSVVVGPVAEAMKPYIEGLANKGTQVVGKLADLIGEGAQDAWTFGGKVLDWSGVQIQKGQQIIAPLLDKYKHYFPQAEPKVTEGAPVVESPNKGIDWDKVRDVSKDLWEKVKTSAIKIGNTTTDLAQRALDVGQAGLYWARGQIAHLTSDPVMDYMRSQLSGGTHSRHQDSLMVIWKSKAEGAGITPGSTNSRIEIPSMLGNDGEERLIHLNAALYGYSSKYTELGLPVHQKELKSNFDMTPDGSPVLWLHRGIMWKQSSKTSNASSGNMDRFPALEPQKARFYKLTDSPLAEMIHHRNIGRDFPNGDNAVDVMLPPTIKTDDDIVKRYALMSYGQIPGDINQKYQQTLQGSSEVAKAGLNTPEVTEELKNLEKEVVRRQEGRKKVYALGTPGKPGMKPVEDTKLGLIKKGDSNTFSNELTDKVNMTPYGSDNSDLDFIPFKFKDLVNSKFIVFRATLEGISDTITPGWNETQYIGRPDKVYTYTGADRAIGFGFKVYPMSKQEMIPMWEKLNYLVGLGYPQFKSAGETGGRLMTPPFVELTIGNLYKNTPGVIDNISLTIEDGSPWDIDVPMQLPKFVTVQIGFKFIGQYALSMTGKHFDLPWLSGTEEFGTFATDPTNNEPQDPVRIDPDRTYEAVQNSGRGS